MIAAARVPLLSGASGSAGAAGRTVTLTAPPLGALTMRLTARDHGEVAQSRAPLHARTRYEVLDVVGTAVASKAKAPTRPMGSKASASAAELPSEISAIPDSGSVTAAHERVRAVALGGRQMLVERLDRREAGAAQPSQLNCTVPMRGGVWST